MSKCPSCSSDAPDGARFCASCGAATGATAMPTRDPPPPQAAAPADSSDPSSLDSRFVSGALLGKRYRIVGLLGRGGMGEVYRADDLELGQSVALKFLPEKLAADPVALNRLRGEVRTARQLAHPNICRVYDITQADGHVFLSMEHVDGDDLSHVLRRLGPPSKEKSVEIARQLCLGLAAAHDNKVLHRDLKPANVMLDGRGRVRITDFGLAGFVDELKAFAQHAGTPAYMAPEQLESGTVSIHSDIYSLGLVLYELFTGKPAFVGETLEELRRSRLSGSVPSMQSLNESVDPAVERVVLRCLEPDPADRPPSVYAALAALPGGDPLAAALAAGETPSPDMVASARGAGGLRPGLAVGLLLAVLGFLAITFFVHVGREDLPENSPAIQSVLAEQVMEGLGYDDLPGHSALGYDVIAPWRMRWYPPFSEFSAKEVVALDWPPRFRYWRRWTRGEFLPDYHGPELPDIRDVTTTPEETVTVSLNSRGHLLGFLVTRRLVGASQAPAGAVDWSPVFRLANLDESDATEIPLLEPPPVDCDEVVAWRMEGLTLDGNPVTLKMGAVGGRPNYFEIVALDTLWGWEIPQVATIAAKMYLRQALLIFMIFLALRNLRASRGDRRNALRCALVIGGLYTLMEVMSLPFGGSISAERVLEFSNARAVGHIILHTLETWAIYMAVEPYLRRVWPRMLVGSVRLLSGRWRDPAVGREVLIGLVTGCGLAAMLAMMVSVEWQFQGRDVGQLPSWWELRSMMSPLHFLSLTAHRAAWTVIDAVFIAGLLVAIRLLTRRTVLAAALGIVVMAFMVYKWGFMASSGAPMWLSLPFSICCGVAIVLLYTRIGIIAGIVAVFVLRPNPLLAAGLDGWFTPYGMVELAILLALAAYGFWLSLAGQPIFKDMFTEPLAET